MKKVLLGYLILMATVLFCACASKFVVAPPFDKATEYAKSGEIIPPGPFYKSFSAAKDDEEYEFRFAYAPQDGTICIGGDPGDGFAAYCHTPGMGYYQYFGRGIIVFLDEKEATEKSFAIFRKMVELGLP